MKLHFPESPHVCVENDSYELLVSCDTVTTNHARARRFSVSALVALCLLSRPRILMAEWTCRIRSATRSRKLILKSGNWLMMDQDVTPWKTQRKQFLVPLIPLCFLKAESRDSALKYEQLLDTSSAMKSSWQAVGEPDAPTWKLSRTQGASLLWEKSESPLPHQKCACNFTQPKQLSPFPERAVS